VCAFAVTDDYTCAVSSFNAEITRSDSLLLRATFPMHYDAALAAVSRDLAAIVYQWATATYVYAMRINIIISKSARLGDHALSPLYSLFLFPCSPSARQGTHYFALFLCSLFFSFLFLCLSLSNTRSTIDRLRLYTFPFLLYTVCTRVSSTHVVACTQRDTWRRIKRVPWKDVAKLMGIVDSDRNKEK